MTLNYYAIPGIRREREVHFVRTTDNIINVVCEITGVSPGKIVGRRNNTTVTNARFMVCHFLYKYAGLDKTTIGLALERDHTTIIYALKRFESFYKNEEHFRMLVDKITFIIEK